MRMKNIRAEDVIGKQFGELVATKETKEFIKKENVSTVTKVLCECSCGVKKYVNIYNLVGGRSTSCGHKKFISKHMYLYRGKPYTVAALARLFNRSVQYVHRYLKEGMTPEEVAERKMFIRTKAYPLKKSRIVKDLFGFISVRELYNHLQITRQGFYNKLSRGYSLKKENNKIIWVKK